MTDSTPPTFAENRYEAMQYRYSGRSGLSYQRSRWGRGKRLAATVVLILPVHACIVPLILALPILILQITMDILPEMQRPW